MSVTDDALDDSAPEKAPGGQKDFLQEALSGAVASKTLWSIGFSTQPALSL